MNVGENNTVTISVEEYRKLLCRTYEPQSWM